VFELVNFLTLWELRVLPAAAAAFEGSREPLERAAGALAEAEAFLCLSLPLVEQPDFEMPLVLDGDRPRLEAEELGHPLLEPAVAVRNAIALGDPVRILIVTGSNMAGKSTYLKSAATNVILGGMGAPVCARGFRWTPVALRTDVNVRDSLDDGKSYFQVEVERVRDAVVAARESPFVLAVFDEVFRGTNSVERLALARAILRWLRDTGALGLVATHDQALTRLVTEDAEPGMDNRHFQESIEGSEMRFDYRLREGPATTRNAIRLVEVTGFPPEIVREAREGAR
jgi:DNA mismatch repair ATPase MutS